MIVFVLQGNIITKSHIHSFNHQKDELKSLTEYVHKLCIKYHQRRHIFIRHQHFVNFNIIGKKTPYFTSLIRDPVDHYISWYYYRRYGKFRQCLVPISYQNQFYNSPYSSQILNMTFDECVQRNNIECTNSSFIYTTVPYFCGSEDYCLEPTEKSLNQAKQNVIKYYPVVGYLEKMTEYLELCEVIWPQFFKGAVDVVNKGVLRRHVSKERKLYEPSAESKEIMYQRLLIEYRFYNWVKDRFNCMYDLYVTNRNSSNN